MEPIDLITEHKVYRFSLTDFRFDLKSVGSSYDELPELWNILKGNMSIIGPRPLLMQYLSHVRRLLPDVPRHC